MRFSDAMACVFMLTGLVGYLLYASMGIWGGILTAGLFSLVFLSYRHIVSCHRKGCPAMTWTRFPAALGNGLRMGRWRDARLRERRARLEDLRIKAHQLACHCGDIYGAQSYCLELISQTEKDDPLFVEACDLYMRTVMNRSRQGHESGQQISSKTSQIRARPAPAAAHIIPFPTEADSH
jgi:hypothetical protein